MENTCTKFGPDSSEKASFCINTAFSIPPFWHPVLIFRYKTTPVFVSGRWKIHVPSLVQIRCKMHGFTSKAPLPSCLDHSISFSKWNSASICFRGIKNNMPSLVEMRRKVHDLASIPPPIPRFWSLGLVFRYETTPVFVSGRYKRYVPSLV